MSAHAVNKGICYINRPWILRHLENRHVVRNFSSIKYSSINSKNLGRFIRSIGYLRFFNIKAI